MKKYFTIVTFLLFTKFAIGQEKNINRDSVHLSSWRLELSKRLKLNKLITCQDSFHFRFWQNGQVLDIWTSDFKTYHAYVTNYIKKYNPNKLKKANPKPDKLIFNQIKLDSTQSLLAYNILIENYILTISSNELEVGHDGENYAFEIATPNSYEFLSFWSPSSQDSLLKVKKIQDFITIINSKLNLVEIYTKFTKTLRKGKYTNGGFGVIIINRKKD